MSNYLVSGKNKLIIYHGFSDPVISPYGTIHLYKELAAYTDAYFYNADSDVGGYPTLKNAARLFMIPGMHHCGGGPGFNPPSSGLTALRNWVENGVAPDGDGTGWGNNPMNIYIPPTTAGLATTSTAVPPPFSLEMPLCAFPEMANLKTGGGARLNPADWSCPATDTSLLTIGQDGLWAGLAAETTATIRGNIDSSQGSAAIAGWACDHNVQSAPQIYVDLYLGGFARSGGTFIGRYHANLPSYSTTDDKAIAAACGIPAGGVGHRFSIPNPTAANDKNEYIYVHGVSSVAGSYNAPLTNSGTLTVP